MTDQIQTALAPPDAPVTVFVTGIASTDVPAEANWTNLPSIWENRYHEFNDAEQVKDSVQSINKITFTVARDIKFVRVRGDAYLSFWNVAQLAAAAGDKFGGLTNITPLPGLSITGFDQVELSFGSNRQIVYTNSSQHDQSFMMNYMAKVKKIPASMKKWHNLAGLFDFTCWDYCGGTVGATQPNVGGITNQTSPNMNAAGQPQTPYGSMIAYGPLTDERAGFPYCQYQGAVGVTCPTATGGVHPHPLQSQVGLWCDIEMKKYRAMFMPNITGGAGNIVMLTKLAHYTPGVWETHVAYPNMDFKVELSYPTPNSSRARYVHTPTIDAAGNAVLAQTSTAATQAAYGGITPTATSFRLYRHYFTFRPDIQSSFNTAFANGRGYVNYFTSYDFVQYPVQNSNATYVIVQSGNTIGYEGILGFQLNYPLTTINNNGNNCQSNSHLYRYCWADQRVSTIDCYVTAGPAICKTARFYNTDVAQPASWDMWYRSTQTNVGTLDGANWWLQQNYNTAFYTDVTSDDTDGYCLYNMQSRNYQMPPQGCIPPNGANTTTYGSHAVYSGGAAPSGYGIGGANIFWRQVYMPLGMIDDNKDQGCFTGTLSYNIYFNQMGLNPFVLHHLGLYRNSLTLAGNGYAVCSIAIH